MKFLPVLLCGLALSGAALADTCLNTDKDRYGDGDARHYDYGKCKPAAGAPDNSYNSLNAIGKQMQGMLQQRETYTRPASSEEEIDKAFEHGRNRFKNLKYATANEVNLLSPTNRDVGIYANATISPDARKAIQQEISTSIEKGQLLETYDNEAYQKPWVSSSDAAQNWKTCEVSTQLVRAYVYGDFIKPEQKNPAKGFAIARAGCNAHCGGTCYWLGRIYEDGNKAAPGVDKVLGHNPQTEILRVYDNAIMNGVNAAYERSANLGWNPPERYKDKTYFDIKEFSSYSYWYVIEDFQRLGYAQYKRCLETDPANINCARSINTIIDKAWLSNADKDRDGFNTPSSYHGRYLSLADLRSDISKEDISFYQDYLAKLEGLLQSPKPAAAP